MALQGLPGISPTMNALIQSVRLFTRDHAELNRLVQGEESSDRQIAWAIADAVSNFNQSPHFTSYSLEDMVQQLGLTSILIRMTTINLLESVGLLQTRNHINYNNGSFSVGVNDKTPLIMQWLTYFRASVDQDKARIKVALNINGILGPSNLGVVSEYWYVNSTYASY
jgi:hypothetical protein